MWEYIPGGVVTEKMPGLMGYRPTGGIRLQCWVLEGRGKVWRTYSSLYPYEAYWDDNKKSKRFKNLEEAQLHVEEQTK